MGLVDSAINTISGAMSSLADSIGDSITTAISNFVGKVMYYITNAFMWLVSVLQQLFDVFSGTTKVKYSGEDMYLVDVFFQNKSISNVYWAITLLGIVFVIVFTLITVVRKGFDLNDKMQNRTMSTILTSMFKSIFGMLILSFALSAALNLTNLTINRISYVFDNADSFSQPQEIQFTDEQYATMARVYKTIGNYSLNPSYNSYYNLNSCYNDVREDLSYLEQQGIFDVAYVTTEISDSGKEVEVATWQSALQELVYAHDPSIELSLDIRHDEVSTALLNIMDILRSDAGFGALDNYKSTYSVTNGVGLDRVLFLSGTTSAARNNKYNENPYLTDGLRGAFYTGEKSIYSLDDVSGAFNIGITGISYIFIWVLAYFTLRNLMRCIFSCIMRIFSMISLYIVAPLTIAAMPLDDGEKFKQWMLNMVLQGLGVLGVIIPMRLVILFAPVILSPDLVLFQSVSLNFIAKVLLIVGGLEAVEGFSNMVTGILTNNSAMTAMHSHETANRMGDKAFDWGVGMTKAAGGAAMGAAGMGIKGAGMVAGGALGLVSDATGATALGRKVAGAAVGAYQGVKNWGNSVRQSWGNFADKGGLAGMAYNAVRNSPSDQSLQNDQSGAQVASSQPGGTGSGDGSGTQPGSGTNLGGGSGMQPGGTNLRSSGTQPDSGISTGGVSGTQPGSGVSTGGVSGTQPGSGISTGGGSGTQPGSGIGTGGGSGTQPGGEVSPMDHGAFTSDATTMAGGSAGTGTNMNNNANSAGASGIAPGTSSATNTSVATGSNSASPVSPTSATNLSSNIGTASAQTSAPVSPAGTNLNSNLGNNQQPLRNPPILRGKGK